MVRMILVSCMLMLAACNTVQGIGKDVEGAGESINDSAVKVKKKINE